MNPFSQYFNQWLSSQPWYQWYQNRKQKKNTGKTKKTRPFLQWMKWLLIIYLVLIVINFFNGTLVLDLSLNAFGVLVVFFVVSMLIGTLLQYRPAFIGAIGAVVLYLGLMAYSSPLFNYQAHRDLIGEIKEVTFSDQMDYIDLDQVPIIDVSLADKLADKKLGDIPSLGSQVTVGTMSLQNVGGQLYYVAPLEHTSFLKWLFNQSTPGYVKVSATDADEVELVTDLDGESLKLKYLERSYLLSNIKIASFLRDLWKGHEDYTFEIDDEGNPYWVVTRYDTGVGIEERAAVGAVLINAQTGKSKAYTVDKLPEWVDRVEPMDNVDRYIRKWGELVHGVLNFTDKDKLTTTYGMSIIYNDGSCYYFTGITSVGEDESLVGFTLTDTRTRETTMYRTSGATELAAMASAEGKVQQYGYDATLPYLLNVDGQATYFMTLKDASGLVKQYALVNVSSYTNVAVGHTLQDALTEYRKIMTSSDQSFAGEGEGITLEEVSGVVARIGVVMTEDMTYYDIMLENDSRCFTVSTDVSRVAALTQPGDNVLIRFYPGTDENYLYAAEFQNITMNQR